MSYASFEQALVAIRRTDCAAATKLFAALADLAADNLEPTADLTRDLLVRGCDRATVLLDDTAPIQAALADYRRTILFFPAKDARAMRCFAIREAEKCLRREARTDEPEAGKVVYRSSSVSS